jgi:transposase
LDEIPGIGRVSAEQIVAETGTDMSKWKTQKHFCSWLNLAPNTNISGGKVLKKKNPKRKNKAGQSFLRAASTLKAAKNYLGQFYRRIKAKAGALKAIKATARKIAIIFYKMIKDNSAFNAPSLEEYNQHFKDRQIKYIYKMAQKLNLNISPASCVS